MFLFEHEKQLTCVHNRIELTKALRFSVRPEDVKHTANYTAKRGETLFVFNNLWRGERLKELLELLASLLALKLTQDVTELVRGEGHVFDDKIE